MAEALGVSAEATRQYSDDSLIQIIQNNYEGSNTNASNFGNSNYHCSFNPLDKLLDLVEENKKLYERLLESEREKTALLREMTGIKRGKE